MRSMATRRQNAATNEVLHDCINFLKSQPYDLVIVETAGIGQSDSEIVDLVDVPIYVMTSEFGAASQLEKIDMLDLAEVVVINKFDKRGAADALRDVRKQWRRNHVAFDVAEDEIPVYPTIASQFNDPGVTWVFVNLCRMLAARVGEDERGRWDPRLDPATKEPVGNTLIPGTRVRYLAEIPEQGRAINDEGGRVGELAGQAQHCYEALRALRDPALPGALDPYPAAELDGEHGPLRARYNEALDALGAEAHGLRRARGRRGAAERVDHRRDLQLHRPRPRDHGGQLPRVAQPPAGAEDRAAALRRLGRPPALPDEGEPAGVVPVHRRRLPLPPRGRGPDADVRRRGSPGADQPPLP